MREELLGRGWSLRPLDDGDRLQRLLVRCDDYYQLVSGQPPGPDEASQVMTELPKGWPGEHKLVLGLWRGPDLLGVLDGLAHYPAPAEYWLGLFLVDPAERGRGLGQRVMQAWLARLAERGFRGAQLGVAEQNQDARRFWAGLGFQDSGRRAELTLGRRTSVYHVLRAPLAPEDPCC